MPGDSQRFDLYLGESESVISIKRWRFTMIGCQSLRRTRWECKYHVVFIPKKRKKRIFGVLRQHLGEIFRELAKHKEAQIVEGHLMGDHVHICISIPPKHAVSNVVGYIKGKSAIAIARRFGGREQNFTGEVFWARGYFVSTVGLD